MIIFGNAVTKCNNETFLYTDRTWLTTDLNQEKEELLEFDISELKSKGPVYLYVCGGYIKVHEVYLEKTNETKSENIYLYSETKNWKENSGEWLTNVVQANPKFSEENGSLYIDSTEATSAGYFYTKNEIDFSKYSKIGVKWTRCKTTGGAHFTVLAGIWNPNIR